MVLPRAARYSALLWLATVLVAGAGDPAAYAQARPTTTEYFNQAEFKANAGSLTVITFDDRVRGNGVLTGNEYAGQGVTIIQRDGHPINVLSAKDNRYYHPANFNSQPNGISSASGVDNRDWADRSDNLDFVFSKPVHAAGLWVGNLNATTRIQFLAAGQCVIATQALDGNHKHLIRGPSKVSWDNRVFYGITTNHAIERIRVINGANDGDGIVLDDIQFGSAAKERKAVGPDSIRIFAAVPFQDSAAFKAATHKSLRVVAPQNWDPIPYHVTKPFTTTITARPGQRFLLAGDAAGKKGWTVDNFLLVEIHSAPGTQRLVVGNTNGSPVEYEGRRLTQVSPDSLDLSKYLPANVPVRLTVSALDFGGRGGISDLFLIVRDELDCPPAPTIAGKTPKVAEVYFVRRTDTGVERVTDSIVKDGDWVALEVKMDTDRPPGETRIVPLTGAAQPESITVVNSREQPSIFRGPFRQIRTTEP